MLKHSSVCGHYEHRASGRLRCWYYSMATGRAGLVRIALHQNLILESSGFAVSMRFRLHNQIRPEFLHPTALDAGIGCGV